MTELKINFNEEIDVLFKSCIWGRSSAGRAPALHAGGREFDPPRLHQFIKNLVKADYIKKEFSFSLIL